MTSFLASGGPQPGGRGRPYTSAGERAESQEGGTSSRAKFVAGGRDCGSGPGFERRTGSASWREVGAGSCQFAFSAPFLTPDGMSGHPRQRVTGSEGERSLRVPQEVPRARPLPRAWSGLPGSSGPLPSGSSKRKRRNLKKSSAQLLILL